MVCPCRGRHSAGGVLRTPCVMSHTCQVELAGGKIVARHTVLPYLGATSLSRALAARASVRASLWRLCAPRVPRFVRVAEAPRVFLR